MNWETSNENKTATHRIGDGYVAYYTTTDASLEQIADQFMVGYQAEEGGEVDFWVENLATGESDSFRGTPQRE